MDQETANLLKAGHFRVVFGWLGKYQCGETNYLTNTVTIGIFAMMAKVFLHEQGHRRFPRWSEGRVSQYEERQYHRMSAKNVKLLGRRIFRDVLLHRCKI